MKKILAIAIISLACFITCTEEDKYHDSFIENFNESSSENFSHHTGGNGADFTYSFGVNSPTEPQTNILSFKIDPEDPAGAGRGPEIISNQFTHMICKITYYGSNIGLNIFDFGSP